MSTRLHRAAAAADPTSLEKAHGCRLSGDRQFRRCGDVGENYRAIAATLDLSNEDLKMLAAMSIRGSWLHEIQKARHLVVIDQL